MDELFRLMSRKNEHLTWSMKGKDSAKRAESEQELNAKNVDVDLNIHAGENLAHALGNAPFMQLGLTSGHFSVTDLSKSKDSFRGRILEELVSRPVFRDYPNVSGLFPMLIDSETIKTIPKELKTPSQFYALTLKSAQDQIDTFKQVASDGNAKLMKTFALSLKKKLGTSDLGTRREISIAESENDYPWSDDLPIPTGNPRARYLRVSLKVLIKKFGEDTAKKMGRSRLREMFGHPVAIGEPLLNLDGSDLRVSFEQAQTECLKLNSDSERPRVEAAFTSREKALDQARKEKDQSKLHKIHTQMPIPGCYLMSNEEWKILEGDFGYQNEQYIPQILPKLNNASFWSSSRNPDGYWTYYFEGKYGGVGMNRIISNSSRAVRCACGANEW